MLKYKLSFRFPLGTFCYVIFYQLNHVTTRPTPLDKDSGRESKACISTQIFDPVNETFLFEKLNILK